VPAPTAPQAPVGDAGPRSLWPDLSLETWQSTRDTVHMWTQIVGKTRLALAPALNHWWHSTLYVNSVGLTTSLMPHRDMGLEIEFDFTTHRLMIRTTRGDRRRMTLGPRSVADFYAEFRSHLAEFGVEAPRHPRPVEVVEAIPFVEDTEHASYDAAAMHDFWLSLVGAHRVLSRFRGEFRGKASPVHFFWGGFDLATTRFSGRAAPRYSGGAPNCPNWVMVEAYDEEVSSCGYWPGGAAEGSFYAYAYPEPAGYRSAALPDPASYDESLGEFLLPYAAVRSAPDPEQLLLDFVRSSADAAAEFGSWPSWPAPARPDPSG
jgi:hypothetical protein